MPAEMWQFPEQKFTIQTPHGWLVGTDKKEGLLTTATSPDGGTSISVWATKLLPNKRNSAVDVIRKTKQRAAADGWATDPEQELLINERQFISIKMHHPSDSSTEKTTYASNTAEDVVVIIAASHDGGAHKSDIQASINSFRQLGTIRQASNQMLSAKKPAPSAEVLTTTPANRETPANAESSITAEQLHSAYETNAIAAEQRFQGKRFVVTGVVESVDKDMWGTPYVRLDTSSILFGVKCKFSNKDIASLAGLSKGQRVVICGIVKRGLTGGQLEDCELQ